MIFIGIGEGTVWL